MPIEMAEVAFDYAASRLAYREADERLQIESENGTVTSSMEEDDDAGSDATFEDPDDQSE
ncbi:hypothetical protein ACOME3_003934 [Neoechinorhynchus agilis]